MSQQLKAMSTKEQLNYLLQFYDEFQKWKQQKLDELKKVPRSELQLFTALNSEFRPFINHVVKMKNNIDDDQREKFRIRCEKVIESGMNSFYFPAEYLDVDFLSDSGSSAMNTKQWAALLQGDESYGSNEGWGMFNQTIKEIFGPRFGSVFLNQSDDQKLNQKYHNRKNFNYLVNQGRGAESILFGCLANALVRRDYKTYDKKEVTYYCVCSNNFFDTTSGHILNIKDHVIKAPNGEEYKITFELVNCPNRKIADGSYSINDIYLGDGDEEKLDKILDEHKDRIAVVVTTITNNSGGSQPVSLRHIKRTAEAAHKYNILYMMDSCRFAENAYMIKQLDKSTKSIQEIVYEIFDMVDGFTISLKKDGIVNCGGALCFSPFSKQVLQFVDQKDGCLMQDIMDRVILQVGHFTYGALTGRDIKATCVGLQTAVTEQYLKGRITQVQKFEEMLRDLGVPTLCPCGTSGVYLDIDKFFDDHDRSKRKYYYGNSLVGLMLCNGIRGCELGASAFSSPYGNAPYKTPEEVSGNFLRLAIPRQLYSDSDLFATALYIAFLYEKRDLIKPVVDRKGIRQLSLHHFKMMFDFAN